MNIAVVAAVVYGMVVQTIGPRCWVLLVAVTVVMPHHPLQTLLDFPHV
jgi:nitrate/nitrite transporter NarK